MAKTQPRYVPVLRPLRLATVNRGIILDTQPPQPIPLQQNSLQRPQRARKPLSRRKSIGGWSRQNPKGKIPFKCGLDFGRRLLVSVENSMTQERFDFLHQWLFEELVLWAHVNCSLPSVLMIIHQLQSSEMT